MNDIDSLEQGDWDDAEGVVDMEGELRFALTDLDEWRDKYKKEVKNIFFLRGLLDKGNKSIHEYETKLDE